MKKTRPASGPRRTALIAAILCFTGCGCDQKQTAVTSAGNAPPARVAIGVSWDVVAERIDFSVEDPDPSHRLVRVTLCFKDDQAKWQEVATQNFRFVSDKTAEPKRGPVGFYMQVGKPPPSPFPDLPLREMFPVEREGRYLVTFDVAEQPKNQTIDWIPARKMEFEAIKPKDATPGVWFFF